MCALECQVDGERWEKEDENAHIGAGTGTGDNSSADDIKIDPNKTSLASGEFGNKDYNCGEQVHKAYRCPKKNENANRGGDERCDGNRNHCGAKETCEKEENAHIRPRGWRSKMGCAGTGGAAASIELLIVAAEVEQKMIVSAEDECKSASLMHLEGEEACILASLAAEEDECMVASLLANEEKTREEECKMASLKTSSDENVCKMAPLAGANEEKTKEDECKMASLKTSSDENECKMAPLAGANLKFEECGAENVCKMASLQRCDDKEKKTAIFGNGSIRFVDDYEWYDSDSGDIGVEFGECEQGGVLDLKLGARNSYTIEEQNSDVIEI